MPDKEEEPADLTRNNSGFTSSSNSLANFNSRGANDDDDNANSDEGRRKGRSSCGTASMTVIPGDI